jgi:hypothetical protein
MWANKAVVAFLYLARTPSSDAKALQFCIHFYIFETVDMIHISKINSFHFYITSMASSNISKNKS